MLKTVGAALLFACALAITARPALALPGAAAKDSKQALIGLLPTPAFLAPVK